MVEQTRTHFKRDPKDRRENLGLSNKEPWWEKARELPAFKRDFYKEHENVASMTPQQVAEQRKTLQISVSVYPRVDRKADKKGPQPAKEDADEVEDVDTLPTEEPVPRPVSQFGEASLPRYLVEQLQASPGFERPTPIQAQAWPIILSGRDMVGIAATGSGKTLAFILPAIVHVNNQDLLESGDGPIVLVLTPTRELACQIEQECTKFAAGCQISTSAVCGGVPRGEQERKLEEGVEILIATPGRLIDFMDTNVTNMRRVTYLVLDEADRMLDMGFEAQLRKIVSHVRPDRQTLMFSATWPKEVEALAQQHCCNITAPIRLQVGELQLSAHPKIRQEVFVVQDEEKYVKFVQLLVQIQSAGGYPRVIVFCETKKGVDYLVRQLAQENVKCVKGLHGDKPQVQRDEILAQFKEGRVCSVLVATDVAQRGLDVKEVQYVINYDMPFQLEDYVHRVGRTARAGSSGVAYSFFTKRNFMLAPELITVLQLQLDKSVEIPEALRKLAYMALKASSGADEHRFKRRWRKISGGDDQAARGTATPAAPKQPRQATVKVSDLLKAKQQAKLAGQAAQQDSSATPALATAQAEPVPQQDPKPAKNVEEPVVKFDTNYFANDASGSGGPAEEKKGGDQEEEEKEKPKPAALQAPVNPVYKKKWGKK